VLDVDGGVDAYTASSNSSTSCQRLGWRDRGLGMRQLVEQYQLRLAYQRGIKVELLYQGPR